LFQLVVSHGPVRVGLKTPLMETTNGQSQECS
jgi:hypothetical protein